MLPEQDIQAPTVVGTLVVSAAFIAALGIVLGNEGGFVDHVDDLGGATNWGITEVVARGNGYEGLMSEFEKEDAYAIYYSNFWLPIRGDDIASVDEGIAIKLFDIGVNMGIGTASKFLQICLNSMNYKGEHYADIAVDGKIGGATLLSLKTLYQKRNDAGELLMTCLRGLQVARYVYLSDYRPQNESFTVGWLRRAQL